MENPSQLLKFTELCMRLATQQVPPYSAKFSKHTFTQPQLVVLYCLKIKLGLPYRDLIDWLAEMPRIQEALGLKLRALKTTLLVDTGAQTVLDLHVTTTRTHDTQIGPQLTERNLEQFEALAADKGYDDQSHRDRLRAWGKRPLIKHREFAPSDKAANARMDEKLSHRRSLVETVISVIKRKYGAAVSSRRWWRQFRELVAICLVYFA